MAEATFEISAISFAVLPAEEYLIISRLTVQPVSHGMCYGGAKEDRTPDLLLARQALSQLSYGPIYTTPHLIV